VAHQSDPIYLAGLYRAWHLRGPAVRRKFSRATWFRRSSEFRRVFGGTFDDVSPYTVDLIVGAFLDAQPDRPDSWGVAGAEVHDLAAHRLAR
jgi:hypothetical protein